METAFPELAQPGWQGQETYLWLSESNEPTRPVYGLSGSEQEVLIREAK